MEAYATVETVVPGAEDVLVRVRCADGARKTLTLPPLEWHESGLRKGSALSEETLRALEQKARLFSAVQTGLRVLSASEKSARAMVRRLSEKGFESPYAEGAARILVRRGYIDEPRQAMRLAERLRDEKCCAAARVRAELQKLGYPSEVAQAAVDAAYAEVDTVALCARLLEKKYRRADLTDEKDHRRVTAGLLRAGYSFGEVRAAIALAKNKFGVTE